jgi:6-phosphogluconate dehydrogenase
LATLARPPNRGWAHVGPPGAGHFVKMVHNGIEYGLMQAYAEGFEILRAKQRVRP